MDTVQAIGVLMLLGAITYWLVEFRRNDTQPPDSDKLLREVERTYREHLRELGKINDVLREMDDNGG